MKKKRLIVLVPLLLIVAVFFSILILEDGKGFLGFCGDEMTAEETVCPESALNGEASDKTIELKLEVNCCWKEVILVVRGVKEAPWAPQGFKVKPRTTASGEPEVLLEDYVSSGIVSFEIPASVKQVDVEIRSKADDGGEVNRFTLRP